MKNICDWNNCNKIGEYKAPIEKDNSKKFRLLCLEHIKEFNKSWNYHNKMNSDEIENDIKFDTIWRRPTKSFGSGAKFYNFSINGEDMGSFENPNAKQPGHSNKLLWSLSKLDLDIKTDLNLIKKRYKELAKKHHPDIKGNSKNSIDKFREIVVAYNYLLERYKK